MEYILTRSTAVLQYENEERKKILKQMLGTKPTIRQVMWYFLNIFSFLLLFVNTMNENKIENEYFQIIRFCQ